MSKNKQTYNPCDDCWYSYTKNGQESGMCEICEFTYFKDHRQSEGEWEDKPTGAYGRMQSWCSACGKHSGIGGIESNRHKPYCPNCGAKMKGGAG
jgi:hypothetical protein